MVQGPEGDGHLDFDGLIIDSETPLLCIWQEIYEQHGGRLTLDLWPWARKGRGLAV